VCSLEIDIQAVLSTDKHADQFTKGLFQEELEKSLEIIMGW